MPPKTVRQSAATASQVAVTATASQVSERASNSTVAHTTDGSPAPNPPGGPPQPDSIVVNCIDDLFAELGGGKFKCTVEVQEEVTSGGVTTWKKRACGKEYTGGKNRGRFAGHVANLHTHVTVKGSKQDQPTLDAYVKVNKRDSGHATLCAVFARHGLPFRLLRDKDFRDLMASKPPHSQDMPGLFKQQSLDGLQRVIGEFKAPTVCIDVGTVFRRYLLITLVQGGKVVVVKAKSQDEMPDKRMTIESVRETLLDLFVDLRAMGVFPLYIVADNAANMQGIVQKLPKRQAATDSNTAGEDDDEDPDDDDAEEEEEDDGTAVLADPEVTEAEMKSCADMARQLQDSTLLFVGRCGAHGLQLITKALEPEWAAAFELAKEYQAQHPKVVKMKYMDPKWNSKFHLIARVLEVSTATDENPEPIGPALLESQAKVLRRAVNLLRRFNGATNFIQRDAATLFDTVAMLSTLQLEFTSRQRGDNEEERAEKTLNDRVLKEINKCLWKNFMSPLLAVVIFFMPSVNRAQLPAKVFEVVRETLRKVNPVCILDWDAWLERPSPPPSTADFFTFPEYVVHLQKELVHERELKNVVLTIAQAAPTEASVERAFSIMKHVVSPVRNRMLPSSVETSLIISSVTRLEAATSRAPGAASETAKRPVNPAQLEDRPLDLQASRSRNQAKFAGWATQVSRNIVNQIMSIYIDRWTDEEFLLEERDITGALRSRADRTGACVICLKPVANHVHKPYVRCTSRKRCNGQSVANFACANFKLASVKVSLDMLQQLNFNWECAKCAV